MNRNLGLLALTGILTLASCGQSNDNPTCNSNQTLQNGKCVDNGNNNNNNNNNTNTVVNHTLNVVLNGDVKDGTFTVQTPSGDTKTVVVSNGTGAISVPNTGKYTVSAPTISGYTVSPTNQAADLTSSDATVTFTTTKVVTTPTNPTPGTQTGVTFGNFAPDANQQLVVVTDGNSDDYNTYQPQAANNGAGAWRIFDQGITNGKDAAGNPISYTDLYIRGKVNFTVTPGTTGKRVEVLLARTTGRDIPTVTETQSADVLYNDIVTGTTATYTLDSTRLGEYEGVREWMILRVDGKIVSYQPVIVDNSGPTQPEPSFKAATDNNSNAIGTWARGNIWLYTTNPDIQDKPDQAAPVDVTFGNRHPAGFEGVRYYIVPESTFTGHPELQTSDLTQRAATLKKLAADTSTKISKTKYVTVKTSGNGLGFESDIPTPNLGDGNYRIYAVSRDQIGNETASASYQQLIVDNTGPIVGNCTTLRDYSPRPFPSVDEGKYISGVAQIQYGDLTDGQGIGVDASSYVVTISGIGNGNSPTNINLPLNKNAQIDADKKAIADQQKIVDDLTAQLQTLKAQQNTTANSNDFKAIQAQIDTVQKQLDDANIELKVRNNKLIQDQNSAITFDTRALKIPDGTYKFNYSNLTDRLGNPAVLGKCDTTIVIDNTPPTVGFNRPNMSAAQTFNSGETVTTETTSSDSTSGVYRTILFWDDSEGQNVVGAPAEFGRSVDHKSDFAPSDTLNKGWVALANGPTGTVNNVKLKALVIDRAGNASIVSDPIKVVSTGSNPTTLGLFNVNTDWTTQAVITVGQVGINQKAMLQSVDAYGRFADADWNAVKETSFTNGANVNIGALPDLRIKYPTYFDANGNLIPNTTADAYGVIKQYQEWQNFKAPLLSLGNLATANNTTGEFTYKDDTFNNLYWSRGFGGSSYSYLPGLGLNAHYDQYKIVPTDNSGAYNLFGRNK